jgi:hypothetical protein
MTKFDTEFMQEVKQYYQQNKEAKQYNWDKAFTADDVAEKYNLTIGQAKRILYSKYKSKKK